MAARTKMAAETNMYQYWSRLAFSSEFCLTTIVTAFGAYARMNTFEEATS